MAFSERLDVIFVRDVDKLVETLTRTLPMDLEPFFEFFQANFSLVKTQFTISLAQFVEIFICYVEQTYRQRTGLDLTKQPFLRASDSLTAEALNKYFFGENFLEGQDLIAEKLAANDEEVRALFAKVHPQDPTRLPLGQLR